MRAAATAGALLAVRPRGDRRVGVELPARSRPPLVPPPCPGAAGAPCAGAGNGLSSFLVGGLPAGVQLLDLGVLLGLRGAAPYDQCSHGDRRRDEPGADPEGEVEA